jgi:hypothetical protein
VRNELILVEKERLIQYDYFINFFSFNEKSGNTQEEIFIDYSPALFKKLLIFSASAQTIKESEFAQELNEGSNQCFFSVLNYFSPRSTFLLNTQGKTILISKKSCETFILKPGVTMCNLKIKIRLDMQTIELDGSNPLIDSIHLFRGYDKLFYSDYDLELTNPDNQGYYTLATFQSNYFADDGYTIKLNMNTRDVFYELTLSYDTIHLDINTTFKWIKKRIIIGKKELAQSNDQCQTYHHVRTKTQHIILRDTKPEIKTNIKNIKWFDERETIPEKYKYWRTKNKIPNSSSYAINTLQPGLILVYPQVTCTFGNYENSFSWKNNSINVETNLLQTILFQKNDDSPETLGCSYSDVNFYYTLDEIKDDSYIKIYYFERI